MPTYIKCQAFFGSDEGRGWSEAHHLSVSTPPSDLLPTLQGFKTLIENYRRPLLGRDRYIKGYRVSYPTASGTLASSPFRYNQLLYPGNQREGCSPSSAAKVRMGEVGNQHFSDIYLRGFWDVVEQDEELDFTTAGGAAWKALLDQYTNALVVGNYGWLGQDAANTRRGQVTNYTADLNNFVTFNLAVTTGAPFTPGPTKINFRAARLNDSNSVLNRTHVVEATGASTVKTVQQTASTPFTAQGTFVAPALVFYKYTGVQYTVMATRREGLSFFLSPGRQKARARK